MSKANLSDRDNRDKLLWKMAERISVNRTVAGVHYPIDSWAGATLGCAVGGVILALCGLGKKVHAVKYDPLDHDFTANRFLKAYEEVTNGVGSCDGLTGIGVVKVDPAKQYEWLWSKVQSEFS